MVFRSWHTQKLTQSATPPFVQEHIFWKNNMILEEYKIDTMLFFKLYSFHNIIKEQNLQISIFHRRGNSNLHPHSPPEVLRFAKLKFIRGIIFLRFTKDKSLFIFKFNNYWWRKEFFQCCKIFTLKLFATISIKIPAAGVTASYHQYNKSLILLGVGFVPPFRVLSFYRRRLHTMRA